MTTPDDLYDDEPVTAEPPEADPAVEQVRAQSAEGELTHEQMHQRNEDRERHINDQPED